MSAADVQARVQALIDHRVASGDEVGVQVAVVEHGRVVVDAVSGSADPSQGRAVAPDTLFWAASTAKGVASAVAHVLVGRPRRPSRDRRSTGRCLPASGPTPTTPIVGTSSPPTSHRRAP